MRGAMLGSVKMTAEIGDDYHTSLVTDEGKVTYGTLDQERRQ